MYRLEEFEAAIDNSAPGQAILWDEAGDAATAHATSKIMRGLRRKLSTCRSKNLYILILYPSFHELPKGISIFRSNFLIHVYDDMGERGHYAVFGDREKKVLYVDGRKYLDYSVISPNFHGTFKKFYTLDEKAYKDKKELADRQRLKDEENKVGEKWRTRFDAAVNKLQQYKPKQKDKSKPNFFMIISNQCFELWYLLHFGLTTKTYSANGNGSACDNLASEIRKEFRKFSIDYSK